jgi:hypothetical protein
VRELCLRRVLGMTRARRSLLAGVLLAGVPAYALWAILGRLAGS